MRKHFSINMKFLNQQRKRTQIQEVILKNSIIIVQISKEDIFNQCTAVVPILYNLLQSVSSHKTDHMASLNK